MTTEELNAREVVKLIRPIVGNGRVITEALLNYYKRNEFVEPLGSIYFKGRQCYRFADIVALAFVLDMGSHGIPVRHLRKHVDQLQEMSSFPRTLRMEGTIGMLTWFHRTGDLAARIREAVEATQRRAA